MAKDSSSIFTYHDPFEEIPSTDPAVSFFVENPTPGPFEFPLNEEQIPLSCPDHQPGLELNDIFDLEDPLSDSFIWAFCNDSDDGLTQKSGRAGHSGFPGEGCSTHTGINENCNRFENNPMPFPVSSVPASQYDCTCCQTLREITHTNGMYVKRLEIHGAFGVITHAVLGKYDIDSSFPCQEFQIFDFQKESIQIVNKFLVQYFEACKQEGYNTLQDPLSAFYKTLCIGLNDEPDYQNDFLQLSPQGTGHYIWKNQSSPGLINDEPDYQNDFLQLSPQETDCPNNQLQEKMKLEQMVGGSNQGGLIKKSLAMQRERTRKLKLKDFKDYFHLPMEVAARKMNVCITVMKKICRKNGVLRWPHRKIKSIERKIAKKHKMLDACSNEEKAGILEDIQKHQQELANIYQTFTK